MSKNEFSLFLKQHIHKEGEKITHTRIGEKIKKGEKNDKKTIYGGSYYIPKSEKTKFYELYCKEINSGKKEYLTETQLETDCSILIDIDLRFSLDIKERQYTESHLNEMKQMYIDELSKMYQLDEPFMLYIFEKKNVNCVPDKKITKDGIHMIIGIKSTRLEQIYLRKRMIQRFSASELWKNLPLINRWDEVLDECITNGNNKWQLYGSTKPNCEPYYITQINSVSIDDNDQISFIQQPIPSKITVSFLEQISAQYEENTCFILRDNFINGEKKRIHTQETQLTQHNHHFKNASASALASYGSIVSRETLDEEVKKFLQSIETMNYELRETYDYTMALPEKYYGTGSYSNWIKVGWALRNIHDLLFIVWVEFSAKYENFNYSEISDMHDKWIKFDTGNPNGLTRRSIMHWLKMDEPEVYNQIRKTSIEYYINESLKNPTCGDVDIANVLYEFYKDQYVCTSITGNIWYRFHRHRWCNDEKGTTLRQHISEELRGVYQQLIESKKQKNMTLSEEEKEKNLPIISKLQEVVKKLGQATHKNNIMTEAKEKFYDKDSFFKTQLDTNPYILCFTNGVIDFRENKFRDGRPEDYVSISTNIKYISMVNLSQEQKNIVIEINDFMAKLFPIAELKDYMWEHLASILIGTSLDETFHMYIGTGRNGKSIFMDLMGKVLGDYKRGAPLSIITASRTKPGGLNPELVELKGARYVVMDEPSPHEQINVGPMKQLTGGKDVIMCRSPYMPEMVRFVPQFKLCLLTNTLMKINSLDDGTWRRVRIVKFLAYFTENPVQGDVNKPYQFKVEQVAEKFDSWKEIFMSMLVDVAKRTKGAVQICNHVMMSSNAYKSEQDCIGLFIEQKIVQNIQGKINQSQLKMEFDKWYSSMYDKNNKPNMKEVYQYFDTKYGKRIGTQPWRGISIVLDDYSTSGDDDDDSQKDEDFSQS